MTLAASGPVRSVLADRIASRGIAVDAALVAGGAVFTGLLAQVEVPMFPVPITGQTLAVVLVGATLGARRGALSMLVYAVAGLAGLPFFSGWTGGIQALALPSFGYVIGFIPAAATIGWLAARTWDRKFWLAAPAFLVASALPFVTGLPYLAVALQQLGAPHSLQAVIAGGLTPFIVGGIVKAVIAAGVLPLAWRFTGRRSR
jgi:biotin transport system substrate-specific component